METVQRAESGKRNLALDSLTAIAGALGVDVEVLIAHRSQGLPPSPLLQKITDRALWPQLERSARDVATSGGMTVQGFYRNEGARLNAWIESDSTVETLLNDYRRQARNPPTKADLASSITILREADSLLSPKASELGCGLSLLLEETQQKPFRDWIEKNLSNNTASKVHAPSEFFANTYNVIRVIADALDGTENFNREIAFYCSGVAILIDDLPRVAAIYMPTHAVVYTAVLPGQRSDLTKGASATKWETTPGNWADISMTGSADTMLDSEAVAVHFTRNNAGKRDEMISKLNVIAEACNGIYALNAGLPAMAAVSTGGLGAYLNNYTNRWDVAAGEVLVRACGGVTQLDGSELSYDSAERTSVLAARNKRIHQQLLTLWNS